MPTASTTRKASRKQTQPPAGATSSIPDKLYFRIGEVAALCGVEAYVLRFWQSEFPQLRPNKSGTGQRLYRRRDVETALRIRNLLYEEGYTIAGARQAMKHDGRQPMIVPAPAGEAAAQDQRPLLFAGAQRSAAELQLDRMRQELRSLLGMLTSPAGAPVSSINSGSREGSRSRRPRTIPDNALF